MSMRSETTLYCSVKLSITHGVSSRCLQWFDCGSKALQTLGTVAGEQQHVRDDIIFINDHSVSVFLPAPGAHWHRLQCLAGLLVDVTPRLSSSAAFVRYNHVASLDVVGFASLY